VVAHDYYDQSHLIRDFKFFTGLSPSAFVKQLAEQRLCVSQPGKFY
jgi:AraC-like DNA-binding protein